MDIEADKINVDLTMTNAQWESARPNLDLHIIEARREVSA